MKTLLKLLLIEEKSVGSIHLTRYIGKEPTGEEAAYDRLLPVELEDIEGFRENGYPQQEPENANL